jgi:hypothetical protein
MEMIMPERVAFDIVGDMEISTIKLNSMGPGYETCIFYANGDNNVVAMYDTLEDAIGKHQWIVEHESNHLTINPSSLTM